MFKQLIKVIEAARIASGTDVVMRVTISDHRLHIDLETISGEEWVGRKKVRQDVHNFHRVFTREQILGASEEEVEFEFYIRQVTEMLKRFRLKNRENEILMNPIRR